MAFIPGISGQKVELFDGVKVDTINEYTVGNGVQLQGRTNGVAIPQYAVGEKVTWATAPGNQATTTSFADWTNAVINLTAGRWLVIANISVEYVTGVNANDRGNVRVLICDSGNNIIQNMNKSFYTKAVAATTGGMDSIGSLSFSFVADLSSATSYKIRGIHENGLGTGSGVLYNIAAYASEFFAVRIA